MIVWVQHRLWRGWVASCVCTFIVCIGDRIWLLSPAQLQIGGCLPSCWDSQPCPVCVCGGEGGACVRGQRWSRSPRDSLWSVPWTFPGLWTTALWNLISFMPPSSPPHSFRLRHLLADQSATGDIYTHTHIHWKVRNMSFTPHPQFFSQGSVILIFKQMWTTY